MLQWGRARASAEMAPRREVRRLEPDGFNGAALVRARKSVADYKNVIKKSLASMGPRSCERGNDLVADLRHHAILRFNGAALVRARKSEQEPIDSYVLILLQWGRARASAEMRRIGIHIHYPIVASMGPRSCERGNGFHVRATCLLHVQLQWGRARASAEIQTLTRMS